MRNAMVATTVKHAAAMISWLQLNNKIWVPMIYGAEVNEIFQHARIIRPSEGILQWQCDWVVEQLVPNLALSITTIPKEWKVPKEQAS